MNDLPRRKRTPGLGVFALIVLLTALLGGLAGFGSAFLGDRPGAVGLGITAIIVSTAMALGFVACVWWWRQIDEAAREAHKWAWWWGGSAGMAVGAVLMLTVLRTAHNGGLPASFGTTPGEIFASGILSILLFQVVGYGLAWAGWWLKHR